MNNNLYECLVKAKFYSTYREGKLINSSKESSWLVFNSKGLVFAEDVVKKSYFEEDKNRAIRRIFAQVDSVYLYKPTINKTVITSSQTIDYSNLFRSLTGESYKSFSRTDYHFSFEKERYYVGANPFHIVDKQGDSLARLAYDNARQKLILFVSRKFQYLKCYRTLRRKFAEHFIIPYIDDSDIDVIVCDLEKLEEEVYKNPFTDVINNSDINELSIFVNESCNSYLKSEELLEEGLPF
jgi:hypothetical protein